MQIVLKPCERTFFTSSSPGSQIFGIPASLTNATDLPEVRYSIIKGISFLELCLLKLISLLEIHICSLFFVSLVSSHAIKETFFKNI